MSYPLPYIFVYMLVGLLLVLTCIAPKSRLIALATVLLILVLFCFSHDSYDYYNYVNAYNAIGQGVKLDYELTFVLLSQLGNRLGLNYDVFRAIVAIIEFTVLSKFVMSQTRNIAYVWLLYLFFPCLFDAAQFRFFLGMTFALFAIPLLDSIKNKKTLIQYLALVTAAGLSHTSFWFMLLLIPLYYVSNKSKLIINVCAALVVYTIISPKVVFDVLSLLPIREAVLTIYAGHQANFNGIIMHWFVQLVYMSPCLVMWAGWNQKNSTKRQIRGTNEVKLKLGNNFINEMLALNLAFMIVLPLQYYATNVSRLQRILAIMNYIYIAKGFDIWPQKRKYLKLLGVLYAALLLFLSMFVTSKTNIEFIWNAHFQSNPFLNFLK